MRLGFMLALTLVPPKPGERPPPIKGAPQLPSLVTEAVFSSSFP